MDVVLIKIDREFEIEKIFELQINISMQISPIP